MAKARSKDSMKAFNKLVQVVDGRPRLVGDPPLIVPIDDVFLTGVSPGRRSNSRSAALLSPHTRGRSSTPLGRVPLRACGPQGGRRGQCGHSRVDLLMLGHDDSDPLFLQAKEAQASVLEPFLGKSRYANHGQRVVEGQRLMQSASDIMLGWIRSNGIDGVSRDYYIRQLWDGKGSAIMEAMNPSALSAYAGLCGWTLARAHARSGDAAAITSYLGTSDKFDRAMATFAETYADQNERDYATLKACGRLREGRSRECLRSLS